MYACFNSFSKRKKREKMCFMMANQWKDGLNGLAKTGIFSNIQCV